jgi:hypothetical protein
VLNRTAPRHDQPPTHQSFLKGPNRMQLSNATVAPLRRDAALTLQRTLPKGQISSRSSSVGYP